MKKYVKVSGITGDDIINIVLSCKLDCYALTFWVILFGYGFSIDVWKLKLKGE